MCTKEQADHSLPYLAAVSLLNGEVAPAQFTQDRVGRGDVQDLLRPLKIKPLVRARWHYPEQLPCRIAVKLGEGRGVTLEKADSEVFPTRPMPWERVVAKFDRLAPTDGEPTTGPGGGRGGLEDRTVGDLAKPLARARA